MSFIASATRAPRPPLHLCALTLNPHQAPVSSPDGTIFDAANIVQLVRRTSLNPITGAPLRPDQLVPLSFSVDPRTAAFHCPVLCTLFHPNVKVVAIATTGNVYSYTAVQRLNLHPRCMRDLLDGTPFSLPDIIVLYDPALHTWTNHFHPETPLSLRRPSPQSVQPPAPSPVPLPVPPTSTAPTQQQQQQQQQLSSPMQPIPPIPPVRALLDKRALPEKSQQPRTPVKKPRRAELPNMPHLPRVRTPEEQRKAVYKRIRKGRKGKGYVRVVTNIGHLNIELHCDKVPMTCDNFLTLAERKYYDGLLWHRVVPGFIAQTGDPTGKGDSGDSAWGGYVKDEIRTSLVHDAPGVVSMANCGRDTNRSQWFVCFDTARHLDGAHTVFGKVVGGLFVLKKMENEAELGHPLTVERVEVLVNPIRQIREQTQAQSEHVSPLLDCRLSSNANASLRSSPSSLNTRDTAPAAAKQEQLGAQACPSPVHPAPLNDSFVSSTLSQELPPAKSLMPQASADDRHFFRRSS